MTSNIAPTPYNSVIMVRAKTQLNDFSINGSSIERLPHPVLIFFHGAAVELLACGDSDWVGLAERPGIDLAYCLTAWRRRGRGEPAGAARASSLTQFWAHQLACWKNDTGTAFDERAVQLRLAHAQSPLGWQETLEVVLAAATLEIPLCVRFEADAWRSLLAAPDQRQAWQQLLDYELAGIEVHGVDADSAQRALGVRFSGSATASRSPDDPLRGLDL